MSKTILEKIIDGCAECYDFGCRVRNLADSYIPKDYPLKDAPGPSKTAKQINDLQTGEIELDAITPNLANAPQARSRIIECASCKKQIQQEIKEKLESLKITTTVFEVKSICIPVKEWQSFWKNLS